MIFLKFFNFYIFVPFWNTFKRKYKKGTNKITLNRHMEIFEISLNYFLRPNKNGKPQFENQS
jgi:hypothetical protein